LQLGQPAGDLGAQGAAANRAQAVALRQIFNANYGHKK
jgi:hypothetical protein